MSQTINHNRRSLLGTAAMTLAAAELPAVGFLNGQSTKKASLIKPSTNASFGPLKQIEAGLLNVGYAEAGPADGPAVILFHGWPYGIYSYVEVAPLLAARGVQGDCPLPARLRHDQLSLQ